MAGTSLASRRGVVRSGLLGLGAVAGLFGVAGAGWRLAGQPPAGAADATAPLAGLKLSGRGWSLHSAGKRRGVLPEPGERVSVHGELLHVAGGRAGDFYSTSVLMGAPPGTGQAGRYVETHHFDLLDGTLVGMGTSSPEGPSRYAVVGGTGRYAGATGTYQAVQRPLGVGGDGTAEFDFSLVLPGGEHGGR